jgi:hypothetical protein
MLHLINNTGIAAAVATNAEAVIQMPLKGAQYFASGTAAREAALTEANTAARTVDVMAPLVCA